APDGATPEQGRGKAKTEAKADDSQARVEGVVVDEANKPVADAVVTFVNPSPAQEVPAARTAADGTFRLVSEWPSVRYQTILASADDGKRQALFHFDEYHPLSTVATVRLVVKPSRTLTVRVTDTAKKPVG